MTATATTDDDDNAAQAAAAAIFASLDQWTSSKLGALAASSSSSPHNEAVAIVEAMDLGNDHDEYNDYDNDDDDDNNDWFDKRDPDMWLAHDDDDDDEPLKQHGGKTQALLRTNTECVRDLSHSASMTPQRSSTMAHHDRAGTPVMSNSSRTKKAHDQHNTNNDDDDDESGSVTTIPYNLESPWVGGTSGGTPYHQASSFDTTTPIILTKAAPTDTTYRSPLQMARHKYGDYRRYYDAVQGLLRQKRVLCDRTVPVDNNDDDNESDSTRTASAATTELIQRNKKDQEVDVAFLSQLNLHAWSSNKTAHHEGNAWKLLEMLRRLGPDAVQWDGDTDAATACHNKWILASYIQDLARDNTETSPAALVAILCGESSFHPPTTGPLVWRRRQQIMYWLERCFREVVPADATRPLKAKMDNSQQKKNWNVLQQGFYVTDKDDELLRSCLSLILAGQLPKAHTLLRESDVAWRAGLWCGGAPHECTVVPWSDRPTESENTNTTDTLCNSGNPRRALWRRMMWMHADVLHNSDATSTMTTAESGPYETAITALLASHLSAALDCAAMRTWDRGLFAIWRSMIDRTIDELLHAHNNNRRRLNPPFPGAAFEQSELKQLETTASLAGMDEAMAVAILNSSPFVEMHDSDNCVLQVTVALLVGKASFANSMERFLEQLELSRNPIADLDLRFLTHVALYWHAMHSTGSVRSSVVDNSQEWMYTLLHEYVHRLHSQGYWDLIVLYSGFLPEESILTFLPRLLIGIESQNDRKIIVNQLNEFLPRDGLDIDVLRCIINLTLSDTDTHLERDVSQLVPSRMDVRKMRSILWLCIREEHYFDAMITANMLLRQFLLAGNKIASVSMFIKDVLCNLHRSIAETELDGIPRHFEMASSEHSAYLLFDQANDVVRSWKMVMNAQKSIFPRWSDTMNASNVEDVTRVIAASAEKRKRIEVMSLECLGVIGAANEACKALCLILEYPRGWLSTEDDIELDGNEPARRADLERLRCELIPSIVNMYHDVCVQTAAWLHMSIVEWMDALGNDLTVKGVILLIDDSQSETLSSVSPRYWTKRALDVTQITENEANRIRSAFDVSSLKHLVTQLVATAELNMKYGDLES